MTRITLIGRATADAEIRFTPSGAAVANFTIADNHRKKTTAGDWEDDGTTFYRVQAWRNLAEQCAEHVTKGATLIVVGQVRTRDWTDREGNTRTSLEITADDIGTALNKWDTSRRQQAANSQPAAGPDPWATTPTPAAHKTKKQPPRTSPGLDQYETPPF